jgi:hypothetical protein
VGQWWYQCRSTVVVSVPYSLGNHRRVTGGPRKAAVAADSAHRQGAPPTTGASGEARCALLRAPRTPGRDALAGGKMRAGVLRAPVSRRALAAAALGRTAPSIAHIRPGGSPKKRRPQRCCDVHTALCALRASTAGRSLHRATCTTAEGHRPPHPRASGLLPSVEGPICAHGAWPLGRPLPMRHRCLALWDFAHLPPLRER